MRYNYNSIKEEGIREVILRGYIKKNMSNLDYSYHDNSHMSDACNKNGCNLIFDINNGLGLPVHQKDETLINLNNQAITQPNKCQFTKAAFMPHENLEPYYTCEGRSCDIQLRDNKKMKDIFRMVVYIEESNVVRLDRIDFSERQNVNAFIEIKCL